MTLSDYLAPLSHADLRKLHEQLALALEGMDAARDEPYMGFTRVMVCQVAEELMRRAPISPEMRRVENLRAAMRLASDELDMCRTQSAQSALLLALSEDDRAAERGGL